MAALKDLLVFIAQSLVREPEKVSVTETREDSVVTLKLSVSPDDMGRVIGKQGRIARCIRTVMKAAAVKEGVKVVVDII